jgi:hypothetical protein
MLVIGSELLQIGAGGALAFVIIREVLNFLRKKRPMNVLQAIEEHEKKIAKLFEYHDHCDLPQLRIKIMNNEKNIDVEYIKYKKRKVKR